MIPFNSTQGNNSFTGELNMNNEEKILLFLESLSTGVAELKTDVAELKTDIDLIKKDVKGLSKEVSDLKIITIHMENDYGMKLSSLYDGYSLNYENYKETDIRIKTLEHTVEKLSFEVKYFRSAVEAYELKNHEEIVEKLTSYKVADRE